MRDLASSDHPAVVAWLRRLGVDPALTRRVIIVVEATEPVRVYVTGWADKGAFDVALPDGLDVEVVQVGEEAK